MRRTASFTRVCYTVTQTRTQTYTDVIIYVQYLRSSGILRFKRKRFVLDLSRQHGGLICRDLMPHSTSRNVGEAVTHSGGPLSPRNDAQTAPLRKPQKSQYRFCFVQTRDRRLIVSQDIPVKLKLSPIHVSFYPTDIAQLTLPFFREFTIYLHNS